MDCHLGIDPQQDPPSSTKAQAELSVLADLHGGVESADRAERIRADHRIPVCAVDLADWKVPVDVCQAVVDRSLRESLATAAGDECKVRALLQHRLTLLDPAVDHLAIAVQELDEPEFRIELTKPVKAGVLRGGGAVAPRGILFDDVGSQSPRKAALPSVELPST